MISGIIEILSENAAVVSAIGMNVAATKVKVFWVIAGQNEKAPYVILARLSALPNQNKQNPSDLDAITFGVYTYASSPEKAEEISNAIRLAMENQHIATDAGFFFDRIYLVDQGDSYDKEAQLPFILDKYTAIIKRPQTT